MFRPLDCALKLVKDEHLAEERASGRGEEGSMGFFLPVSRARLDLLFSGLGLMVSCDDTPRQNRSHPPETLYNNVSGLSSEDAQYRIMSEFPLKLLVEFICWFLWQKSKMALGAIVCEL